MRTVPTLFAGVFVLAAFAAAVASPSLGERGEAALAKSLEGRIAGKPVDCIQQYEIRSSEIVDGTAILYWTAGNRVYVNRPAIGKESLRRGKVLVTDTHTNQLCSVDTVKLLDNGSGFPAGFVGLGAFVPYTKAVAAR
jgi:hypothetical protein